MCSECVCVHACNLVDLIASFAARITFLLVNRHSD